MFKEGNGLRSRLLCAWLGSIASQASRPSKAAASAYDGGCVSQPPCPTFGVVTYVRRDDHLIVEALERVQEGPGDSAWAWARLGGFGHVAVVMERRCDSMS